MTRRSGLDVGDLDLGVLLTVTLALAVTGLVLVLEDRDLRALRGSEDLDRHGGLGQLVGAGGHLLAVDEHEDGQGDRVTYLVGHLVDLDDVADSHLLLLAATAHDRVHHGLTLFVGQLVRVAPRHARRLTRRETGVPCADDARRRRGSSLRTGARRVKTTVTPPGTPRSALARALLLDGHVHGLGRVPVDGRRLGLGPGAVGVLTGCARRYVGR